MAKELDRNGVPIYDGADAVLAKSGGKKGKGKGPAAKGSPSSTSAYFAILDDVTADGVSDVFVAGSTSSRSRKTGIQVYMIQPCAHVGTRCIQRGANGYARMLTCTACDEFLVNIPRSKTTLIRDPGAGLWQ